jgi:hypothetical protein
MYIECCFQTMETLVHLVQLSFYWWKKNQEESTQVIDLVTILCLSIDLGRIILNN